MAHDWIKMRVNLVTHPKVLAIAEYLSGDEDYQDWSTMAGFVPALGGTQKDYDRDYQSSLRVTRYVTVCALLRFWGYANEHSKDEFIAALRINDLDDIVQVPAFGAALASIGWVEYDEEKRGLSLPNFNEYNASANDRGAADRQKRYRENKKNASLIVKQISDVTRDVTSHDREEKRREDKTNEAFASFWSAYPKKKNKGQAEKTFAKLKPDSDLLQTILNAVEGACHSADWLKNDGQFIPYPATWLAAKGWEDESTSHSAKPWEQ